MTNATIPAGYKQTEVGIIPEDWEVKSLGDVASFGGGTTPSRSQQEKYFANGVFLWVKTTDLNNSYIYETEEKVTQSAMSETCLTLHPSETILVAMYGGLNQIGRTGLLLSPATINQALSAVIPNDKLIVSHYALHYLNFKVDYWKSVASSSRKDPNITSNDIKSFPIILPSIKEQTAIAIVLSDVDALIASLNAQIAKKRDIKTATMQQLLTGKQRLAGFGEGKGMKSSELGEIPEDWEVVPLSELIRQLIAGVSVNSIDSDDYDEETSAILKTSAVYNGRFFPQESKKISATDIKRAKINPHANSIIVSRMNTPSLVGECGYVDKSYPFLFVPDRLWSIYLRSEKTNVKWLVLLLGYSKFHLAIKEIATGTSGSMKNIAKPAFLALSVFCPPSEEQAAIAGVLSAMDEDIAALEQRLAKTKAMKQGMMQELLTGRTRLVVGSTKPSPFDLYEQTKRENFVHSSRLEGIHMPMQKPETSLADVLAKYRAA
ncbi:type I restriction enzyme, S subunit [Thiothrix caldifontis]|uniref:Type I restriction enzyme, S subunit n=1 Tax=Thiothrix caldifontis TaxID=525918 RepID=A0A1H4G3U9_9GAMM|nr:YhfG family protein [Thiothrix caldifontis]SEB03730.1 type I restriction enzyme, S subunit [Thiothrix caldifontis]